MSRTHFQTGIRLFLRLPLHQCVIWTGLFLFILTTSMLLFLYSYTTTGSHLSLRQHRNFYFGDFNVNVSVCKLPILDPWHSSVKRYIKDLEPLDCKDEFPKSWLRDGVLYFKEGVSRVTVKEIRRVPDNDDEIEYRHIDISEQRNQTRKFIHEGYRGNIQHFNRKCFHPTGGLDDPENNTQVVLNSDCNLKRIEFEIIEKENNTVIRHVLSSKCLTPVHENSTNIWKVVFSTNCDPVFRLLENGRLQHIASGYCVQARKEKNEKRPEEDDVVLRDHCEGEETRLYSLDFTGIRNVTIKSEFLLVRGRDVNGEKFKEIHLQATPKPDVQKRPIKSQGLGLNVFMIMLDSTSAAHFHRKMRKSVKYLQNELDSIFFKGEGIVGDGTTAQLSAMLTGIAEENQTEARTGKPGAKSVDDWRWIYKDYKDHGYATLLSEDEPSIASFNMRLVGFDKPPTDHYGRPFWLALDKYKTSKYCFEEQVIHNFSFSYVKSFCKAYPERPKFALSIYSYITHGDFNTVGHVDHDLVRFLDHMKNNGHMNNSLVIIFGDHGNRISDFRSTTQGRLEERLPFLSITVPPWLPWKYPDIYRNLKHNSEVLTSPFDVYATLRHVLSYPEQPRDIFTGQSLFNRIDRLKRNCPDTGIDTHWCPCMEWEKINTDENIVKTIANSVLEYINNLTSSTDQLRNLCQRFRLQSIKEAWKETPNTKVQTFKKTHKVKHCDSCVAIFGRKVRDTLKDDTQYQIQLVAQPGPAVFEASVRMVKGQARVNSNYISRINRYGDEPYCIRATHTHLMKYCYCRELSTRRA